MTMGLRTVPMIVVTAIMAAGMLAGTASAKPQHKTPADVIHPNIHQNNTAGNNANPNGNAPNGKKFEGQDVGGGNMHGIGNNPGQSGADPSDGAAGFADQLNTVHGGILDWKANKRATLVP